MEYRTIELSCSETKELVKWLNAISFTRHIFVGTSKDLYFFAIDYYERFTLARSISTVLPEKQVVFNGSTIGIEKEVLLKYFTDVLTNTPGAPSVIRIGMDCASLSEVWLDGMKCTAYHKRSLRYDLTFNYRITSPREFCKHIINFCLLGCPCTITITDASGRSYLSVFAENQLCTFKNLFHLSTIADETIACTVRQHASISVSLRNMRTVHQAIVRQHTVDIALTTGMLGLILDTRSMAIISDANHDLYSKTPPQKNKL